ncbi:MAG TPA: DNA helicase RecQ [Clostridiales bacterium]|nr:DNA helicase RecQ [Clostridiales bacterium]
MTKQDVLKQYFGHSAFREGQEQVIDAIRGGRDVLCVMPTGAGKSLCYQVPALMSEGVTLVISPLISLMKDQVESLVQSGVPATYVNSTLTYSQYEQVLWNIRGGVYKLIYVAPERLNAPDFSEVCDALPISNLIVDEAHCVSQWGQNFRPSYLKIAEFVRSLPKRPTVGAFTATATGRVKADIEALLELKSPLCVTTGFDRPNLFFGVEKPKSKSARLLALIRAHAGKAGIIYAATRKNVEEVCETLNANGIRATRYHAGLSDEERRQNQDDFIYGRVDVIVATNAFGMGIDKSDVSYVIHYNMPKDIESYYQEAGRAGRDGERAECILLYSPQDVMTNRFLIARSEENPELTDEERETLRERDMERLRQMTFYCTTGECLRRSILRYFGEVSAPACGNCSNCLSSSEMVDVTVDAQKILSCVIRTGQRFGKKMICDILRGSKNERLLSLGLQSQTTYGLLSEMSERDLRERLDFLEERGYLVTEGSDYPILKVTPKSRAVLYENETLQMRVVKLKPREKAETAKKPARGAGDSDAGLFEELRQLRFRIAKEQGVPAYIVFSDAALRDMSIRRPTDLAEFLEVNGVGQMKAERYGAVFTEAIRAYLAQKGQSRE